MKIGDIIDVTLADGSSLRYRVTGNVATPYDDPNVVKVMNPTDRDVITVITCGGSWVSSGRSANGGNYSHRIIVRAERVVDSVGAAGG
jgi:sortase (surface protein transpeptidase)